MRQAIIWTIADSIYWRIYVALDGDVFNHNEKCAISKYHISINKKNR